MDEKKEEKKMVESTESADNKDMGDGIEKKAISEQATAKQEQCSTTETNTASSSAISESLKMDTESTQHSDYTVTSDSKTDSVPDREDSAQQSPLPSEVETTISLPSLPAEPIDIKIIYNKKKYDHTADLNNTILELKADIEKLTGELISDSLTLANNLVCLTLLKCSRQYDALKLKF